MATVEHRRSFLNPESAQLLNDYFQKKKSIAAENKKFMTIEHFHLLFGQNSKYETPRFSSATPIVKAIV